MNLKIDNKLLRLIPSTYEPTWRLLQKKSLNIHRGVIECSFGDDFISINELAGRIRTSVKKEFNPSWLRSFGFGAVIHMKTMTEDFLQICHHIDTKNKKDGVWQWAIIIFDDDKVAVGIHTWLHGYLRPVYDSLMVQLMEKNFECQSTDAKIDTLLETLGNVQTKCKAIENLDRLIA